MKYRKKPVVIEAKQLTDDSFQEIYDWISESSYVKEWCWDDGDTTMPSVERFINIKTMEGFITASEFDWVIKGVKGEFYPCKPDIFEMTYEPTEGKSAQEPVAWMHDSHVGFNVPLYTAPPQREWQGLTNEEIMDACSAVWASHPIEVGRVVEAKLREKNA